MYHSQYKTMISVSAEHQGSLPSRPYVNTNERMLQKNSRQPTSDTKSANMSQNMEAATFLAMMSRANGR